MIVCDQSVSKAQYQKQQQEEEMEQVEEQEEKEPKEETEDEEEKEEDEQASISSASMEEEPKSDTVKSTPSVYGDAQEGRTVFIRIRSLRLLLSENVPLDATQKDLFQFFRSYGEIESVKVCKDKSVQSLF